MGVWFFWEKYRKVKKKELENAIKDLLNPTIFSPAKRPETTAWS
jgi:hypothetical protein